MRVRVNVRVRVRVRMRIYITDIKLDLHVIVSMNCTADLVFLIDSSGSIGEFNYFQVLYTFKSNSN